MNFQLKTIFISVFLFSNTVIHCQHYSKGLNMNKEKCKYDEIIELKLNEKVYFEDSLSIILTHFSHKLPYVGGPTKSTAYLTVSKDTLSEEISLSVHGIQGKSACEDGLSDHERYECLVWQEYEFQLKNLVYDKSIEILFLKKK